MRKLTVVLSILIVCMGCAAMSDEPTAPPAPLFYPPLPERPRLQYLVSISGERDLGKRQSALNEFIFGRIDGPVLGKPYDVAASKGKIYVLDRMMKKLAILDLTDGKMSHLDDRGSGRFGDPAGIWVSEDDFKYVADMKRKQVLAFDDSNRFLRAYGSQAIFEKPVDVAVYGNRMYVIDMDKEQLFILDRQIGQVITVIGTKGDLFKPSHVTVGPDGDVFVTDAFHFRISRFSPDGQPLGTIGFHGDQVGGFVRPKGAATDQNGRLYVVDAAFENVQIFDAQGRMLLFFGGPGNGPGNLHLPSGIAVDRDEDNTAWFQKFAEPNFELEHLVYVTNLFGKTMLNVYGFGHWVGESLPGE